MPRLAANISWLFTEWPFLERPAAAAACGFDGVECLFPDPKVSDALAMALRDARTEMVMFNMSPGNWNSGGRGLAAMPGREREFAAAIAAGRRQAACFGTRRLHVMAGILPRGSDAARARDCYVQNLRSAAQVLAQDGIMLLIEPINRRDMPGYFLTTLEDAITVQDLVGEPNLRIQADLYHLQIAGGDLSQRIGNALPRIGHVQLAGVPARTEPDTGELRHEALFKLLDERRYDGWIGCEYQPRTSTAEGLGWARPWLRT